MEKEILASYLDNLHLGGWRYYDEIGSTNDAALEWAREGAPDWSLVIADSQIQGRGREGRRWVTEAGSALALSLILRPTKQETELITRFTALGALGLLHALANLDLKAEIKWPNDVLLNRKKVAGVLVEGEWQAENLVALVVGIGVNITEMAVPPANQIRYPATSVETMLGSPVDRWKVLVDIINAIHKLRSLLVREAFIDAWNQHLAFRNEQIFFRQHGRNAALMKVEGVTRDGWLVLNKEDGEKFEAVEGEIEYCP